MNKGRLILRKLVQAKTFLLMTLVGLVFAIGGFIVMKSSMKTGSMTATTATITAIDQQYDPATETYEYDVTVEYTDADGNKQTATLSGYDSSWGVGKELNVKYDPANPGVVYCTQVSIIFYIVMGVGVVLFVFGIVKIVLILKKPLDESNEFNKVNMNNVSQEQIDEVKNNDEELQNYYFHFTGKLGQSYIMETNPDRKPIYEAVSQKMAIVTKFEFNFINHLTGKETMKTCSHTTTTEYGGENLAMETNANFKIDGKNCWQALGDLGYSLEPHLHGLIPEFDVLKYGVKVAHMKPAGTNVATGKNYKWGNLATGGIYTVECRESDVEGVFLACFIISRTYDYN